MMTGKGRRTARITVDALGWDDTFGAIVTGEDVKEQKPQPEGPLLAAKMLGVEPKQCAFVGDSPADISAALPAPMSEALTVSCSPACRRVLPLLDATMEPICVTSLRLAWLALDDLPTPMLSTPEE